MANRNRRKSPTKNSPGWLFKHFNSRIGPRREARYLGKRPKLFTHSELDEQLGEQQEEVV